MTALRETRAPTPPLSEPIASQTSPSVFVILDFHPYLSDPLVIRRLDMKMRLEKNRQTLVFVS